MEKVRMGQHRDWGQLYLELSDALGLADSLQAMDSV